MLFKLHFVNFVSFYTEGDTTNKLLASAALALSSLAFTAAAQAAPLQWTLKDVTFDDGGTATGSFVYDADSDTYSNVQLSTTAGSVGGASDFRSKCVTPHCINALPELIFVASSNQSDLTNVTYLDIEPSAPLSNTPGTVELAFGMSTTCGNAACSTNGPGLRAFFSGQLVGVPYIAPPAAPTTVPTLNQWSLAGLSMLLAAWALLYRRCAS